MTAVPGKSNIEWCTDTWNPVTGCTEVSAGCDNCYAATLARGKLASVYSKALPVVDTPDNRADPFAVRLWPDRLEQPLRWKQPRMIFVNSMSDLFHKDVPTDYIRRCFEVMLEADHHVYQILTKRPARAAKWVDSWRALFRDHEWILPNHIWVGTSVEDQRAIYRVRHLIDVPARVRFLSCEPLIGPLDLRRAGTDIRPEIDWVIVGGESGPNHRPMDPDWARRIRDDCQAAGIAFFFKQWGGRTPKAGGRLLDGKEHNEFPEVPGDR